MGRRIAGPETQGLHRAAEPLRGVHPLALGRRGVVADHATDPCLQPPAESVVPRVGDRRVERREVRGERRFRVGREKGRHTRPLPGDDRLDVGRAGARGAPRPVLSVPPGHRMTALARRVDRSPKKEEVSKGPRPNEQDPGDQGTSTRAVATLPRRSVARTTTTWGLGPARSASEIS